MWLSGGSGHLQRDVAHPDCHYQGTQHQLGKNTEEQEKSATTHILKVPHYSSIAGIH